MFLRFIWGAVVYERLLTPPQTKVACARMLALLDLYLGIYSIILCVCAFLNWYVGVWSSYIGWSMVFFSLFNLGLSQLTIRLKHSVWPEQARLVGGIIALSAIGYLSAKEGINYWFPFAIYAMGLAAISQVALGIRAGVLIVGVAGPYLLSTLYFLPEVGFFKLTTLLSEVFGLSIITLLFHGLTRTLLEHGGSLERVASELKEKQSMLVQSAKLASLGEMSSGVAHELNNPLHFINGFNNRIKKLSEKSEKIQSDQVKVYITKISENCERMRKIILHFREFSRQSEHKMQPLSLSEVVYKAFILLNEQLRLRKINVEKNLCPQPLQILGDENRLEQVLVNFITNARDALEKREDAKLTVSTYATKEGQAIIELSDNGSGIPAEHLEKIFNPFFTTKDVGKGTGLGLSISHRIIKEHGGEILCFSEEGKGTTFRLTFPRVSGPI